MAETCMWSRNMDDDSGMYETTCRNAFLFTDGGPKDNKFQFCCYCGKPLEVNHFTDEDRDGTTEVLGPAGVKGLDPVPTAEAFDGITGKPYGVALPVKPAAEWVEVPGENLMLRQSTPSCDCPGNGKPDKRMHAPNCPYRAPGVMASEPRKATDAEIAEWAERHDLRGSATDLRAAFEDAASLHLTYGVKACPACLTTEPPPLPEHAAAWVVPGDDGGSLKEWVDAKAERDGEFTAPLFTAAQMREYALAAVAGVPAAVHAAPPSVASSNTESVVFKCDNPGGCRFPKQPCLASCSLTVNLVPTSGVKEVGRG